MSRIDHGFGDVLETRVGFQLDEDDTFDLKMHTRAAAQAEAASRKLREAEKLEKRKAIDWSDTALNPLYAERAREEGEHLLAAPEHLVGDKSTELVSPRDPEEEGGRDYLLATLDEPNVISVAALAKE